MVNMGELFSYDRIFTNIEMDRVPISDDGLEKFKLKKGDLLFARQSLVLEGAGKCSVIMDDTIHTTFESHIIRCRLNEKLVNPLFYYYFFNSFVGRGLITSIVEQVAAAGIRGRDLSKLPVLHPPIEDQKSIAHILGTLDDKIELNRQMNSTLEQIAQTLFKRWFIDFEFPDEEGKPYRSSGGRMVDSELGEIPEGWGVKSLYDCAQYINGAAFKSKDFSDNQEGLPIIKISELKNGITSQTKFTTKKMDQKCRITNGEILFSWSGSPDTSIDIFLWTEGEGWLNQHTFRIIPQKTEEKEFLFFLLKNYKKDFIEIARNKQTTGLGHVTSKDLKNMYIPFPSQEITKLFRDVAGSIFSQIFYNSLEHHNLSNIRDLLLPKLMSGKIKIPIDEDGL